MLLTLYENKSKEKKNRSKEADFVCLSLIFITNFNYFKELRLMLVTHIYIVNRLFHITPITGIK
jgi:hypothetical protein